MCGIEPNANLGAKCHQFVIFDQIIAGAD
jgi:hypothetical protein